MHSTLYRNNLGDKLEVKYVILNRNVCVFTATSPSNRGSSINFAEEIVEAIARAENRPFESLRYFDLQTRKSYGSLMGNKPNAGDFEFDEVILKNINGGGSAIQWSPTKCPEKVADLFKEFMDGVPHQSIRIPGQEFPF